MSRNKRKSLSLLPLDIEVFISEIQQRQAIWDVTSEEYSNQTTKKNAWRELLQIFYGKEAASRCGEKEFLAYLQKKWKNLRDCFSRELRKITVGSETKKKPEYIYYEQLSFLEKVISPKEWKIYTMEEQEESSNTNSAPKRPKLVKLSLTERQTQINSGETSIQKEAEIDCDRMFLLSLLDPLKQIPEYARFGVKRKLMEVLDNELQIHAQTIAPQITITENFIT